MSSNHRQRLIAEAFGTFALVFAGTGAIVINEQTSGTLSHVGVALTFGLVVLAMVYSLGEVSGAHLNPAVTVGFFFANRFSARLILPYVLCQCSGALMASLLLRCMFPNNASLGATLAFGGVYQSLIMEIVLTMILMMVILSMSVGAKEIQSMSGIVIGSVIALEALFAGPISGASMNPARSLGPALVSGNLQYLWLYIFAPVFGAFLGVVMWKVIHGERLPEPSSAFFQTLDKE